MWAGLIGLAGATGGTIFGVWWQRRDARAEWLRVLRFEQFVELDRRVRELVAALWTAFAIVEQVAERQATARRLEQDGREAMMKGLGAVARLRLDAAAKGYESIAELGSAHQDASLILQSKLREIELDLGRYALLLPEDAVEAVASLLGHVGPWLTHDPLAKWDVGGGQEAAASPSLLAARTRRIERSREQDRSRIGLLRQHIAACQREFLVATQRSMRLKSPRDR